VRRDCEPHRSPSLLFLGLASFVGGMVLPPFGLVLGIVAWRLVGGDLVLMDRGLMDPAGRYDTVVARQFGLLGAVTSGGFVALGLLVALAALYSTDRPPQEVPQAGLLPRQRFLGKIVVIAPSQG
jgi:hypothetical protein